MKISIDIDCTPEEARRFLGLPDVAPLQEELLRELGERLRERAAAMDVEALAKAWLVPGAEGWEALQKMFWSQLGGMAARDRGKTSGEG